MESQKRKIKVLHIITLFSVGGATETVVSIAKGLKDKGYDVTIISGSHISSEGNMLPIAKEFGLNVTIIPDLKRNIHPIYDLKSLFHIKKIIKEGNFDIVQTHSSKAGIIGRFAARLAGVKHIVHTIHGLPFHSYQNSIIRWLYIFIEKLSAKITSVLVAVSNQIVKESLHYKVGKNEQFVVIRSGFNTDDYRVNPETSDKYRKMLGFKRDDFVIGKISRLSKLKGHSILIQVLPNIIKEFPQVKIMFVGDGEMMNELVTKVKGLGINEHVIFTGAVPPSAIPDYLSAMDAVIHTSLHEGLPRVIPQALLMRKPVITYNLDGAPEIIIDDYNGLLIPPLNDELLQNSIKKLIKEYPKFYNNCVDNEEPIRREFDEMKTVTDICKLYDNLLS
ncbi:MAG: glycosyltransferase family 4 protein [Bacteroidota bacterium]|nr:glycosyltransferase family 4 protein [Bacteroidota bacterium]